MPDNARVGSQMNLKHNRGVNLKKPRCKIQDVISMLLIDFHIISSSIKIIFISSHIELQGNVEVKHVGNK